MSFGQRLQAGHKAINVLSGSMVLHIVKRKVTRRDLIEWVAELRRVADDLEAMSSS